ncbi:MAG: LysM peptidoglycan-binding domain-containing protein [Bacteroidota bacterium]
MVKIILIVLISWNNPEFKSDSLRLETIKGKQFIIHQVSEKETLYSISKHYGVSIMNILEFNKTADGGLDIGQILKVPYVPKSKIQNANGIVHKVATKETLFSISKLYDVSVDDIKAMNKLSDNSLSLGQELIIPKRPSSNLETVKPAELQSLKGTHTVVAKETLFSISKKYGITVQQLKEWNGISGNEVKIDQVLLITQPMYKTESFNTQVPQSVPIVKDNQSISLSEPKETTIKISENMVGSDEVKEKGTAELIAGTDGNRKYLALYNAAKVGTIMKVRNEANNREVFVRVMDVLPQGTDNKTIIMISKSAFERLGVTEGTFAVEVTYYK